MSTSRPRGTSPARRPPAPGVVLAVAAPLLVAAALVLGAAAPSYAGESDGYRYWNYSHLRDGEFVAAQTGAADHQPADGDVEGWRFGTSTVSQGIWPRADLAEVDFEAVCAGTEAGPDEKRVAVLVDYGLDKANPVADGATTPDPRAACALVPEDADGRAVLDAVAEVRADEGLVCGLDGYPATGCGDPVSGVTVPAEEPAVDFALPATPGEDETEDAGGAATGTDDEGGLGWPVIAGLLALVVLAAGTLLVPVMRQRRLSPPAPRE